MLVPLRYWNLSSLQIADNRKAGSTSVGFACNDILSLGLSTTTFGWRLSVPFVNSPTKNVYILVRDPVQRFVSAMAQLGLTDADAVLAALASPGTVLSPMLWAVSDDPHFYTQSLYTQTTQTVKAYQFPSQLSNFASDIGFVGTFPTLHVTPPGEKQTLSSAQISSVQTTYADDLTLYSSITTPGKIITPVVVSAPLALYQQAAVSN